MSGTEPVFDVALAGLLLMLAVAALHAPRLSVSVIVFIAFGLVLALTWARLGAPDLALAEAAIGAGLTGALLLGVLSRGSSELIDSSASRQRLPRRDLAIGALGVLVLLVLFRLVWQGVSTLPEGPVLLPNMAAHHLQETGVEHPVTAVLLNYRAWDTLLELVVLLLALLGVRQVRPPRQTPPAPWPLLLAWTRVLAPLTVLVGGYVLWRGAFAPGGAFQAGAVLAAGAVALRLCQLLPPIRWQQLWVRVLVVGGLVVFLLAGMVSLVWGGGWLAYPRALAGGMILLIEVAATLSIATTLTLLVVGEEEELWP